MEKSKILILSKEKPIGDEAQMFVDILRSKTGDT